LRTIEGTRVYLPALNLPIPAQLTEMLASVEWAVKLFAGERHA